MRILFLSQHYRPEPCDTRTSRLAEGFADRGHKATALTSFPNYPLGKVYDGYKQRLWSKKYINGVNVVRVPMFPDHSRSAKKRGLSYLSFGSAAFLIGGLVTGRPDLIWIHHPPLTTAIAGYLLAKAKRVPFVLEIHDLWPESLTSTGMIREGKVTRAIRKVCQFLYKRATAIIVTSPGMKTHLERQNVSPDKIVSIPQWADETIFHPVDQDLELALRYGLINKRSVVFAGNIGTAQGMDTILDAASKLTDIKNFQFVLIGDGLEVPRLKQRCEREGIENVTFVGQQPSTEVAKFLAWSEAGLVHLRNDPLFAITIPSKTQAYMACGVPIICGVAGDGAEAVEEAGCGLVFTPEDSVELAAKVRALLVFSESRKEQMGEKGLAYFREHFAYEGIMDSYEMLFSTLLGGKAAVIEIESAMQNRAA